MAKRKSAILERDVLKQVLQYLAHARILAWRNNTGGAKVGGRFVRFGLKGSPDVLGVLGGGRLLACEVKRPGGKTSEAQTARLESLREAGALAVVVHCVDELRAALRAAGEIVP